VRDGNGVGVVQLTAVPETWTEVSPWVWVLVALGTIAGIVIAVVTGPPGWIAALKGGAIGFGIGFAIMKAAEYILESIGSIAAAALAGALGVLDSTKMPLLPPEITAMFGAVNDVVRVDFDDLMVGGTMRVPRRDDVLHEGMDVVLSLGDAIDLDRGVIRRGGSTVAGFIREGDIEWRAEELVSEVMARMSGSPTPERTPGRTPVAIARRLNVGGFGNLGGLWQGRLSPLGTACTAQKSAVRLFPD
jgi:hypothetical protein